MRIWLLVLLTTVVSAAETLDLSGTWEVALDRADAGVQEGWATRSFADRLSLPGSLQAQGFGDDPSVDTAWTANVMDRSWWTSPDFAAYRQPGNVKIPCWLQPRKHYVGVAWYRRTVEVPTAWAGRRLTLALERVHWTSRLWIDGAEAGSVQESLSAPHTYDLTGRLAPGSHVLSLRIDNRMLVDVGNWAHSVSDHTQTNWNGVIGTMTLTATSPAAIAAVRTFPQVATRSVRVEVDVTATAPGKGIVRVGQQQAPITWTAAGGTAQLTVSLGADAGLWDEFQPTLHPLTVELAGDQAADRRTVSVGLREVGRNERRMLTINGQEILLRGTLECCIFPQTGYPPTDVAAWARIIDICRDHGLNHLRFHSWCPPAAAFEAADAKGFYLQVEVASWCQAGKGKPIDAWITAETERIVAAHGNHPSLVLLMVGNEMLPYGGDADRDRFLSAWSTTWAARDTRRLYAGSTLTTSVAGDQFRVSSGTYGAKTWATGTYNASSTTLPHIVHEMGQYCVFPDFRVLDRPTGFLQWKNFEIFRDRLRANSLQDKAANFLEASGKLQALCYKEDIEAVLRAPDVAGYQLLDLHDFPGQGTALVGVLDAEWNSKGYITPAEYRRFAGATVPLATLPRVLTSDQRVEVVVGLSHYGPKPIGLTAPAWAIMNAQNVPIAHGHLDPRDLPRGRTLDVGRFTVGPLAPGRYRLDVVIDRAANSWPIEVVPATPAVVPPAGVELATTPTDDVLRRVAEGATVVLCANDLGVNQPPGAFVPIFWNRQWFPSQKTMTLGLLTDPQHPALTGFPTASHSTWVWKDVVERSSCLPVAGWPDQAIIARWIDDWNTSRSLALVAECRLGTGKLVIGAFDAQEQLAERPATRQLVRSLLAYADSPACAPVHTATLAQIQALVQQAPMIRWRATATADSAKDQYPVQQLLDGRAKTNWHTDWKQPGLRLPQRITITLPTAVRVGGVRFLARQDEATRRAKEVVLTINDQPVQTVTLPNQPTWNEVPFPTPQDVTRLVVEVRSTWDGDPNVAFAEIELIPAP